MNVTEDSSDEWYRIQVSELRKTNWIDWLVAHIASKANKQQYISVLDVGIDISTYTFQNLHVCMPK